MSERQAALVYAERWDGGVLAVWNRRHGCFGLPGGKVAEGESIIHSAMRELYEEVAVNSAASAAFYDWGSPIYTAPTFTGSGRMCYVFRLPVGSQGQPRPIELDTAVGWMSRRFLEGQSHPAGLWFHEFFLALDERKK